MVDDERRMNVPVKVRGTLTPSQTRTALVRRSTTPAENRPATVSTMKHFLLLTYLLRYLVAGQSQVGRRRRANRGNGVWRRNCVQICLRGATHKLLSVGRQLVGGQQTHVTIQPHCKQSNRFAVVADVSSLYIQLHFHYCNMYFTFRLLVAVINNVYVSCIHRNSQYC